MSVLFVSKDVNEMTFKCRADSVAAAACQTHTRTAVQKREGFLKHSWPLHSGGWESYLPLWVHKICSFPTRVYPSLHRYRMVSPYSGRSSELHELLPLVTGPGVSHVTTEEPSKHSTWITLSKSSCSFFTAKMTLLHAPSIGMYSERLLLRQLALPTHPVA